MSFDYPTCPTCDGPLDRQGHCETAAMSTAEIADEIHELDMWMGAKVGLDHMYVTADDTETIARLKKHLDCRPGRDYVRPMGVAQYGYSDAEVTALLLGALEINPHDHPAALPPSPTEKLIETLDGLRRDVAELEMERDDLRHTVQDRDAEIAHLCSELERKDASVARAAEMVKRLIGRVEAMTDA